MIEIFNLLAMISDESRGSLVVIGLAAVIGGVMLMFRHKFDFDEVSVTVDDPRVLRFEKWKFRRRSLASTMFAAMGILMFALYWAREPAVFIGLISVVLILLIAISVLAFFDLMSVGLHTATQKDDARTEMIDEYLRQRQKLLDRVGEDGKDLDPGS